MFTVNRIGRIIPKYSNQNSVISQRMGVFGNRVTTLTDGTRKCNVYEPGAIMRFINKKLGRENVISCQKQPGLLKRLFNKIRGKDNAPDVLFKNAIDPKTQCVRYYEYEKATDIL